MNEGGSGKKIDDLFRKLDNHTTSIDNLTTKIGEFLSLYKTAVPIRLVLVMFLIILLARCDPDKLLDKIDTLGHWVNNGITSVFAQ